MYHYVEDKEFLHRAQKSCSQNINNLTIILRNKYNINSQFFLVGSGGRNMVTQNENGPIDFDYNLNIISCPNWDDVKGIKESVRKAFNEVMRGQKLNDVQDSTSSLTTAKLHFRDKPEMEFSMDVCIVTKGNNGNWFRLIHEKTGNTFNDRYFWNEAPHTEDLKTKVVDLKANNLWNEVRECYLEKKNMYLTRNDHNHPSFICYIEAVNEVYGRYKWTKK